MVANLQLYGLNHRTAPLNLREQLVLALGPIDDALRKLQDSVEECVILSTCNRLEVYVHDEAETNPFKILVPSSLEGLDNHVYNRRGTDCINHLLNVASSLDSMIIGETQIIGQVREAYELARTRGTAGRQLHTLFQSALAAAKEVQTETGLGRGHLSLGSIAVDLAKQVWERLDRQKVLVLGSGEMGTAVVHALKDAGAQDLVLSSRTRANAESLATETGARVIDWLDWPSELATADICVTAVASDKPIITRELLRPICDLRRNRPLLLVDLSVPRNITTNVDGLSNLYRYDLDGLGSIQQENSHNRHQEINSGQIILTRHATNVASRLSHPDLGTLFQQLDERRDGMLDEELDKLRSQFDDQQIEMIRKALHRYGNRLLHPIRSEAGEVVDNAEDLKRLFFGRNTT